MKNLGTENCEVTKIYTKNEYDEKYGFHTDVTNKIEFTKGLSTEVVKNISKIKSEDKWMRSFRQKAYKEFLKHKWPTFGPDLTDLNFDEIKYFVQASDSKDKSWESVPTKIQETFEKLGIPEAEKKYLAGIATQYESEIIYENLKEKWAKQGIIFLDISEGYKKYPDIFKKYFSLIVPIDDNKFAALNSAVFSGGSFIYIPKHVKLRIPLQTYFRINTQSMGQFERTLIIADEGSEVHYIEGCTAPTYSADSLHAAVVEVIVLKNARVRYTTIQNWSTNVLNLVTKRALVHENGIMEWVDCNLGSKITMKYPAMILKGDNSHGEILSIALANKGQTIDAGGKAIHIGKNTSSIINSKSICLNGGRSTFRGFIKSERLAHKAKSKVNCEALILDNRSQTDTYPTNLIQNKTTEISHEASVSKLNSKQLSYLMSRGLSEAQASSMIVSGFIEPIVKELPMEYAAELNTLINLSMEGSVG